MNLEELKEQLYLQSQFQYIYSDFESSVRTQYLAFNKVDYQTWAFVAYFALDPANMFFLAYDFKFSGTPEDPIIATLNEICLARNDPLESREQRHLFGVKKEPDSHKLQGLLEDMNENGNTFQATHDLDTILVHWDNSLAAILEKNHLLSEYQKPSEVFYEAMQGFFDFNNPNKELTQIIKGKAKAKLNAQLQKDLPVAEKSSVRKIKI